MRKIFLIVALIALVVMLGRHVTPLAAQATTFKLTVMHTSENHGRWEAEMVGGNPYGGIARRLTMVNKIRADTKNVLLVDSGDVGQGTLYFIQYKGTESRDFYNALGYDAVVPGNHDADWGAQTMADNFVKDAKFSLVLANVDLSSETALAGKIPPYVIKTVGGEKIGIFGMITDDILVNSSLRNLKLRDAVQTANDTVADLTKQGVNKIIMLSHRGIEEDRLLIAKVNGIDVIISGHNPRLMGDDDKLKPFGAPVYRYPLVQNTPNGGRTVIADSYQFSYLLGKLDVTFDENGNVINWGGENIVLDKNVAEDSALIAQVANLAKPFADLKKQLVGKAAVDLDGVTANVRGGETNLGNLITDAMLWSTQDAKTQIAIMNGGGIRASIKSGDITYEQVLTVLPFGNRTGWFDLAGADVIAALENGVSQRHDANLSNGRFPQVGGIKFTADLSKPVGQRVTDAQVGDLKSGFKPLDKTAIYRVVTNDFMRDGGDGYTAFQKGKNFGGDTEQLDQALLRYLKANPNVSPAKEGRITLVNVPAAQQATATAVPVPATTVPATATVVPPTATSVPPTATRVPAPTATPTPPPAPASDNTLLIVVVVIVLGAGAYLFLSRRK